MRETSLSSAPGRGIHSSLRANGVLDLGFRFDSARQRTALVVARQVAPLKVIRAFSHGSQGALVHLHNSSGGLLAGDRLALRVAAGPGTHALLTTTSATRIHRRGAGDGPAVQSVVLRVAAGGCVEYLPDVTIPFAASCYHQEMDCLLAPTGRLLLWDVVAPGRRGFEEAFHYFEYASAVRVQVDQEPIAMERFRLRPDAVTTAASIRCGPRSHFGTLLCCDSAVPPLAWLALEREVHELLATLPGRHKFVYGVSALVAHGAVVRCLGDDAEEIFLAFNRVRALIKKKFWAQIDPLPRKLP